MEHEETNDLPPTSELSRREFLRTASLVGAGLALGAKAAAQSSGQMSGGQMDSGQSGSQSETPPSGTQDNGPTKSSRRTTGALGSSGKGPPAPNAVHASRRDILHF